VALKMVRSLRARFAARPDRAPAIPDGQRVYAIGDVHGRADLLHALIALIRADDADRPAAETSVVVLGDLVDRGPDSRGVIDLLLDDSIAPMKLVVLGGNHDEVFVRVLNGEREAVSALHRMGGRATALSYGVSEEEYDRGSYGDLGQLMIDRVPAGHAAFLRSLREWHRVGDYVFVHAGIRPGKPMEEQLPADMRWIRSVFLDHAGDHGAMIVHGHTITDEPHLGRNRIGIDTGAYASGRLTAIGLEGTDRWLLST
jgi:serine/threonine protein phosphatase 1